MLSFVVCQQQQLRSVSLFVAATNSFVHLFVSCDTVAFHHCVLGKSWVWLFLLGLAPFAFWFVFLCWMAKRISGWGICVSLLVVGVCVLFVLLICHPT